MAQEDNIYDIETVTYVMNATADEVNTKAFGNHFTFKPKQIKAMRPRLAAYLAEYKGYQGLVVLPAPLSDLDFRSTQEGKELLAQSEQEGIDKHLEHLRSLIYNNQVSLRNDLSQADIKADPAVFASKGELDAMRKVAMYAKQSEDSAQKRTDEVKELMKTIGEVTK